MEPIAIKSSTVGLSSGQNDCVLFATGSAGVSIVMFKVTNESHPPLVGILTGACGVASLYVCPFHVNGKELEHTVVS